MESNENTIAYPNVGFKQALASKPVKVISITGGKGGIGKSNIAINTAVELAKNKQRVLLFDADLGLANIHVLLGLKVERHLQHVLDGECDLSDILIRGPHNITIVPASSGVQRMADLSASEQASLIHAFSTLSQDIDVMIIDTAAGISNHVVNFSHAAQEIIIVVCNEPTSIADAYALIKVLNQRYHIHRFRILTNMTRHAHESKELYKKLRNVADRFLQVNLQYSGAIPYDEHLRLAVRHQRAAIEEYPGSRFAGAIKSLAKQISNWDIPIDNSGRMAFFLERLINVGN